jgi:hypothetical protein
MDGNLMCDALEGLHAEKGVRLIYFAKLRRNKNPDPIFGGDG